MDKLERGSGNTVSHTHNNNNDNDNNSLTTFPIAGTECEGRTESPEGRGGSCDSSLRLLVSQETEAW